MRNGATLQFSFDEKKFSQCQLSILLSNNKIAFSIFNTADNQYIFFKQKFLPGLTSLAQKLRLLADSDSLLQKQFRNINIVLKADANVLIPAELFTMETAQSFAKSTFGEQNDKILKANYLKDTLQVVNLFLADEELDKVVAERFADAKMFHITTPLIYSALATNKGKTEPELYVELSGENAWVVLLQEQKLLFCNHFGFAGNEDLTQRLLNLYSHLNLNRRKTPLILSGNIDSDGDNSHFLNKTFKEVYSADLPDVFSYAAHLRVLLTHEYCTFLNLPLCES